MSDEVGHLFKLASQILFHFLSRLLPSGVDIGRIFGIPAITIFGGMSFVVGILESFVVKTTEDAPFLLREGLSFGGVVAFGYEHVF